MTFKRTKWCVDCNREDASCRWCDICTRMVCMDCDDTHDCLADSLDPQEEAEIEAMEDAEESADEIGQLFETTKKESEDD